MQEGSENKEDGRFLRNCLVESMWADVQMRSKKLGQDNPSFKRKQIEILSEQFQATLISYDEGLWHDDKALACALWRRFFESDCSDFTKLEKLVKYVRRNAKMLDEMNRNQLLSNPKVDWVSLNET
jgi:cytochrome b pre-mRNA-processing protein 3